MSTETRYFTNSYFGVLTSLVAVLVLQPHQEGSASGRVVLNLIFSVLVLYGLWIVQADRRVLAASFVFGLPSVLLRWAWQVYGDFTGLLTASYLMSILFLFCLTLYTLRHVLSAKEVTAEILCGAVSAYILIGFSFSYLYGLIGTYDPLAFRFPENTETGVIPSGPSSAYQYFSFVTLTTLGYGDVTPLSNIARSVSVLQAVVGQMFTAILVARLVGMSVERGR